jgi:hypothetical protein
MLEASAVNPHPRRRHSEGRPWLQRVILLVVSICPFAPVVRGQTLYLERYACRANEMPIVLLFRDPVSGNVSVVERWDGTDPSSVTSNGNGTTEGNYNDELKGQYRQLTASDVAGFHHCGGVGDVTSSTWNLSLRNRMASNDEESVMRGIGLFPSNARERRRLAFSNATDATMKGNETTKPDYFYARECGCHFPRNPIVYCPFVTDSCLIPVEEGALPGCKSRQDGGSVSLGYLLEMIVVVGFAILFLCFLLPGGTGAHARDFVIQSCCYRKWNEVVVDRIMRNDLARVHDFSRIYLMNLRTHHEDGDGNHRHDENQHQNLEQPQNNDAGDNGGSNQNDTMTPQGGRQASRLSLQNMFAAERQPTSLVLKTRRYRKHHEERLEEIGVVVEEDDVASCAICFVTFADGDRTGVLPCRHVFHANCLKMWLKRKNVCPLCQRKEVAKPQYNNDVDVSFAHP